MSAKSRWTVFAIIQAIGAVCLASGMANVHSTPLPFIAGMLLLLPGNLIWMTGWFDGIPSTMDAPVMLVVAIIVNWLVWFCGSKVAFKIIGHRRSAVTSTNKNA